MEYDTFYAEIAHERHMDAIEKACEYFADEQEEKIQKDIEMGTLMTGEFADMFQEWLQDKDPLDIANAIARACAGQTSHSYIISQEFKQFAWQHFYDNHYPKL